jgi:threonine/homoserine/homoserine lactone efflux protein
MVSLAQLAVFVPAAALVALSPGANNILALQHGMRFGAGEAVIALAGRLSAFLVMLGLAAAGLAAVLTRSQAVFEAVKWAGVAYLAYLGVRSIAGRGGSDRTIERSAGDAVAGRLVRARREFLTVAANPKALLLFTAFLPQFVDRSPPVSGQLIVLGLIYIALELAAAAGWAIAGERLTLAGLGARARRRVDQAVGGVFLGLAGLLAASKR